mmetsp:Transcript_14118/g.28316  ORF Transcript_14118/g.28316 Transcript_14118/m.28316 type:complete len:135 (+) Transcript_14118:1022-1426(+)
MHASINESYGRLNQNSIRAKERKENGKEKAREIKQKEMVEESRSDHSRNKNRQAIGVHFDLSYPNTTVKERRERQGVQKMRLPSPTPSTTTGRLVRIQGKVPLCRCTPSNSVLSYFFLSACLPTALFFAACPPL